MSDVKITRIVAADVRSSRLGYAVFEAPLRLIDWGIKWTKQSNARRIADVLTLFQPSVVVLPRILTNSKRNSVNVRRTIREIRSETRRASLPIATMSEKAVKKFFESYGFRTRHEIASALATLFPELASRLPPSRRKKPWKAESARMSIFDAARLGIFFSCSESNGSNSNEIDALLQKLEPFRRSLGGVAK